ncbi:hypothetical protein [Streptomyces sp. NBC_00647]|uniref:hypothetical protein n=1 Tax=Streptomyces sp. NBC_00647 TaxID=2975796 RepID=UPI0038644A23
MIRKPAPPHEGRFLHRDFHPGKVLFDDVPPFKVGGGPDHRRRRLVGCLLEPGGSRCGGHLGIGITFAIEWPRAAAETGAPTQPRSPRVRHGDES